MRRFLFGLIGLVLLAAPAFATSAEDVAIKRSDVIRLVKELPEVAPVRADMERLGFRGQNLELAVQQYNSFYRDNQIAEYIADRVLQVFDDPQALRETGGLAQPLILRGLGHLPLQELHFYYRIEQAMLNGLSRRECGLIVRNRLSPQRHSDAMARVAARLSPENLQEFYRIERKAVHLGLRRAQRQLSPAQVERVEEAIRTGFEARVQADPDVHGLEATLSGVRRLDNKRACQLGRIFYSTVLEMRGNDLRNGMIYLGLP